eukprot:195269-Lingulodinium_polyedra.AAC.1
MLVAAKWVASVTVRAQFSTRRRVDWLQQVLESSGPAPVIQVVDEPSRQEEAPASQGSEDPG